MSSTRLLSLSDRARTRLQELVKTGKAKTIRLFIDGFG